MIVGVPCGRGMSLMEETHRRRRVLEGGYISLWGLSFWEVG